MDYRVWCILVAAGGGSRFRQAWAEALDPLLAREIPKQFLPLDGIPLYEISRRRFARFAPVERTIVVLPTGLDARQIIAENSPPGVLTVNGGSERRQSVAAGLRTALDGADAGDVILIHDAVRPFLLKSEIENVIRETAAHGAATLARAVSDTIVRKADGAPVPREGLAAVQTPQGVRGDLAARLLDLYSRGNEGFTDETTALSALGYPARHVACSPYNLKLTWAQDWRLFQAIHGFFPAPESGI